MSTSNSANPKIVSRDEWLIARKRLLAREKQITRERDAIAAERRSLPWVKLDKAYVFDSPSGKKTLTDLFEGKGQLIVYHFMFGPDWQEGCPSCSFISDHTDATLVHLAQRDVAFVTISRAPLAKIEPFFLMLRQARVIAFSVLAENAMLSPKARAKNPLAPRFSCTFMSCCRSGSWCHAGFLVCGAYSGSHNNDDGLGRDASLLSAART